MKINDIIEYAIEFAWQMGDKNENIPRAESRWEVLNKVLNFIETREHLPDEDIDEVVQGFLSKKNIKSEID
ncbi:hypothetical protein [Chryseobacterium sp. RLHN22]|uniref:hypothetical protein n=1 Tax=Chryseobacterium sp. RLHN22 TaxID=3437885 RepID=UPI003D9AC5B3